MSSRASLMSRQTLEPTSTTAWCISALTFSCDLELRLRKDLHLDVRAEIAGLRIDGLVFLFDSDAEAGPLHCDYPLVALLGTLTVFAATSGRAAGATGRRGKRSSDTRETLPVCSLALRMASSATASTIQWKLSSPTELMSASGAGFMKSMAYGMPSSQANSTVLRS